MAAANAELQEIQADLALVKKALRENGSFLGMSGEPLQRYFLQLNEKENLLLSKSLQSMSVQGGNFLSGSTSAAPVAAATNGAGYGASAAPAPVARELPAGAPEAFDRDSLSSVCSHLSRYEASATECAKALRALSSLAYSNARTVGDHPEVLPQALRALSLHPEEGTVQLNGMRALCNMAYDPTVALSSLSSPSVVAAFIDAMSRKSGNKEIGTKASEAVARIVAAEVGPESGPSPAVPPERGPLRALFSVVAPEDQGGRDVVIEIMKQLVNNEVATPELLVDRLLATGEFCKESGPGAASWLSLSKQIAMSEIANISETLITRGALGLAGSIMVAQHSYAPAQLAGIEAMSGLVGSRWAGLQAFAEVKGIERIEAAMSTHPSETVLQTKGIRALASGVQWPEDIQRKASFNAKHGVKLTKTAMANHVESEELQVAGLEALQKYVDRAKCHDEVKEEGGTGLVKAVMMRHSLEKVRTVGTAVLEALGEKGWKPKGQESSQP